MADIYSIPDFPGMPGQAPTPGAPTTLTPVSVVLLNTNMTPDSAHLPLNQAVMNDYIADELTAGRAITVEVERWNPWGYLTIPGEFEDVDQYNYARFTMQGGTRYYAYITAAYVNLNDTGFDLAPDWWTTYLPEVGYGFVERGHVAVAAATQADDPQGSVYCDAPEPFSAPPSKQYAVEPVYSGYDDIHVVVVAAADLRGDGSGLPFHRSHPIESMTYHLGDGPLGGATVDMHNLAYEANGILSNLAVYDDDVPSIDQPDYPWSAGSSTVYVPLQRDSEMSTIDGLAAGGGCYIFTRDGWANYLARMVDIPWITSSIVATYSIPANSYTAYRDGGTVNPVTSGLGSGFSPAATVHHAADGLLASAAALPVYADRVVTDVVTSSVLSGWRNDMLSTAGTEYRKLLTSPFTTILLTDGDVHREYLPELWNHPAVTVEVVPEQLHGGGFRIKPDDYANGAGNQFGFSSACSQYHGVEMAGYGMAYSSPAGLDASMFGQSINVIYSAQAAIIQALLSVGVMSISQAAQTAMTAATTNQGIENAMRTAEFGAVGSAIGGVLGGKGAAAMIGGGISGAASSALASAPGVINTQRNANVATQNLQTSQAASLNILDMSNDQSKQMMANNLGSSLFSAAAAYNTSRADMEAHPGAGSAQGASSPWRMTQHRGVAAVILGPTEAGVRTAVQTWARYGYMIGRAFVPPRLDPMDTFSYWKISNVSLKGKMPSQARQAVTEILANGTTFWTDVSKIGNHPPNTPRAGVSY